MRKLCLLLLLMIALLAACGGGTGGDDTGEVAAPGLPDPAETVERYLTAKVGRDAETVRALLCPAMEADLERETHTFDTVSDARIEDMTCAAIDADTVQCAGRIVATYGAEETEFALSSYRVVEEDGEWRWCGESE
jgi:hypothetical protein